MKKQIVVINGSGGVGKDTFIDLCEIYTDTCRISTVDKVKEAAKALGWTGGKTERDRLFLSDLKLLAGEYNDHSYCYVRDSISKFEKSNDAYVMFIHCREPKEIERLANDFNALTLLIKNKNVSGISSNMADANVDKYTYDFIINNDGGFHDFEEKARIFVDKIL